MGYVVAHLVEKERYEPQGCKFDSQEGYWNLSLTKSFQLHCGPGVDSTSNRNEYQRISPRVVKAAGA
jgi:hypothetical protein